jgi:tetraacyldisaccharide 4'-kinase
MTFSPRKLLLPLVPFYRLALALRELRLGTRFEPVCRLHFPVVSIGNLSAGGAGKTPTVIALAQALMRRGLHVDVLSRGYGRESQLPARVGPDGTYDEFGDEPLLIARETGAPVYVAPLRYEAGLLAEAESAAVSLSRVHLLDDGFQHRQLFRDVNILLIDRGDWRDWLLPAGNLREPLRAARRATVMAIPAEDPEPNEPDFETVLRAWGWQGPVWRLHRTMQVPTVHGPVVAFCGIARPEQFFAGLESAGLHLAARFAFPDHHPYSAADRERLLAAARQAGAAALVTTEKDRVRLGHLAAAGPDTIPLETAGLRVEIEREDEAVDWLLARIIQSSKAK